MFGSISNWINTNIPQNIPTMPNMPAMPTMQMPAMPTMPQMNLNPFKKGEETGSATTPKEGEEVPITQTEIVEQEQTSIPETKLDIQVDLNNIEPVVEKQPEQEANPDGTNVDPDAEGNEHKFGVNLGGIHPTKAMGAAKDLGNNIGSTIFSFGKNVSSNVRKTASNLKEVIEKKTLIGEFSKENEKFINEKKEQKRKEDTMIPPWVGYNEEEKMKEQILALSLDSRNFLRSPPVGVDFPFDFNLAYPVASATLEEDPNLNEMRFKLVPKQINEETFWRNFFYRVSLIKQSAQLDQLNTENQNQIEGDEQNSDKKVSGNEANNVNESLNNNEFVSDSYEQAALNDEDLKNELKQLKLNSKKENDLDESEWDNELPEDIDSLSVEEIEKEINQMIGKH